MVLLLLLLLLLLHLLRHATRGEQASRTAALLEGFEEPRCRTGGGAVLEMEDWVGRQVSMSAQHVRDLRWDEEERERKREEKW